jgi:hypothetical protein
MMGGEDRMRIEDVRWVAVVGAGTMRQQIAFQAFATSASRTVLRLAPAVRRDRSTLRGLVHATVVASLGPITHAYPVRGT